MFAWLIFFCGGTNCPPYFYSSNVKVSNINRSCILYCGLELLYGKNKQLFQSTLKSFFKNALPTKTHHFSVKTLNLLNFTYHQKPKMKLNYLYSLNEGLSSHVLHVEETSQRQTSQNVFKKSGSSHPPTPQSVFDISFFGDILSEILCWFKVFFLWWINIFTLVITENLM